MRRLVLLLTSLGLILATPGQVSLLLLNIPSSPAGRLPEGWGVKVNHGTPEISTGSDETGPFLRLQSHKSSYALERAVDVDVEQYPFLSWRWKVLELPRGGDFRHAATDDQAAQVLVAFQDRRVLTYIWDTSAPKGTMESASSIPLLHIVALVCESGPGLANQWVPEARNLAADFQKAYSRRPPHVKGIRLQINSQHTGTSAESEFAEVTFRTAAQ